MLVELIPKKVERSPAIDEAKTLTDYAVSTRYPGEFEEVSENELQIAIRLAESILIWAKEIIHSRIV